MAYLLHAPFLVSSRSFGDSLGNATEHRIALTRWKGVPTMSCGTTERTRTCWTLGNAALGTLWAESSCLQVARSE